MVDWYTCMACGQRAEKAVTAEFPTCPGRGDAPCGGEWQRLGEVLEAQAAGEDRLLDVDGVATRSTTVVAVEREIARHGLTEAVAATIRRHRDDDLVPARLDTAQYLPALGLGSDRRLPRASDARTTIDQAPSPETLAEMRAETAEAYRASDLDAVALALGLGARPTDLGDIEWQALIEEEAARLRVRSSMLDTALAVLGDVDCFPIADTAQLPASMRSLQRRRQRNGSVLWAVCFGDNAVLTTDGTVEVEPLPSSRDDAYFARTRFTLDEACEMAMRGGIGVDNAKVERVSAALHAHSLPKGPGGPPW